MTSLQLGGVVALLVFDVCGHAVALAKAGPDGTAAPLAPSAAAATTVRKSFLNFVTPFYQRRLFVAIALKQFTGQERFRALYH